MRLYLFDCDETLEISAGPVKLQSLVELKMDGHIIGINGNWSLFINSVSGWQNLISVMNVGVDKVTFMAQLKEYTKAFVEEVVMVGNILGVSGQSDCAGSAEKAGVRFIKESDFAAGVR